VWTAAREGSATPYDLTAARTVDDPVLAEQLALVDPPVSGRTPVGS
jgi:hypothetical protein